ncbi:MAG TPA: threonine--tRNA ligase [Bacilli bacterium]|nr:threonine--tRNA ligase [Bacilli bacterium]
MKNIKEDEKLNVLNHSCAHLLAHAIKRLYPNAKFWVGPVIEDGFYYDIDLGDITITESDFDKIEKEMKKISKDNKLIKKIDLPKKEALDMFKNDPYKIDLINNMDSNITAYKQDDFIDLCKGPHVEKTGMIKYFKLTKASGAYFKGDSNNKMLQRIYGICFENEDDLNEYIKLLEEAKKRDHKKLGKELELFMISEFGAGFPFWLPKGMIIRNIIENFWYSEHQKEGYKFIKTPMMLSKELWELSGHWDYYKDNMYISKVDDREFAIKPMNCPGGMLVYKNSLHSYKDLPERVGELGFVHRHEASGALNGLFRVRAFTQDDAHIFMTENQMEEEIIKLLNFISRIYKVFNLEYSIELSTRPEDKYIGSIDIWDKSEKVLADACKHAGKEFKINPGDGAFYGPKLDIYIKDSLNRMWQCGTIQLDMNLPERFDLTYIEKDGSRKRPVMIHRVILGSVERFIGILIEHYAGAFPLWLAPVQVNIIPVNNEYHLDYAKEVNNLLSDSDIRVELDDRNEKLSYKMRDSQVKKIPITIIIGDKEIKDGLVSYRRYNSDETYSCNKDDFIRLLVNEIKSKK